MKRALLLVAAALAVWLGGRELWLSLRSDDERIRAALAEEVAAFDAAAAFSVLRHFAEDYRDVSGNFDRGMLRGALLYAFQNRRTQDGAFRHRTEIDWDRFAIAMTDPGAAAETTFPLVLYDQDGSGEVVVWAIEVVAKWARRSGEWWITGSTHRTTAGKRPW